jgi:hypothetical protein
VNSCRLCRRTDPYLLEISGVDEVGYRYTLHECLPCRWNLWIVGRRFRSMDPSYGREGPITWMLATPGNDR